MTPWALGCWYYASIVVLKKQHGVSWVASWMGVCQTPLISWSWQLLTKVEVAPAWKGEHVLSASHCLCLVDCYCFFIVPGGVEKDTLKCTLSKWRLRLARAWLWDSLHLLSTQGVAASNIDSEVEKKRLDSIIPHWLVLTSSGKGGTNISSGQFYMLIEQQLLMTSHWHLVLPTLWEECHINDSKGSMRRSKWQFPHN